MTVDSEAEVEEVVKGLSAEERRDFLILVGAIERSDLRITGFRHKARFKKLGLVQEDGHTAGGLRSRACWTISAKGYQVAERLSRA